MLQIYFTLLYFTCWIMILWIQKSYDAQHKIVKKARS